jgi:1-acyl-sn-glycerol-3-phosphate acyltransferase
LRVAFRCLLVLTLTSAIPLLLIPHPGQARATRLFCRILLRGMGVRVTRSGGPIRNVPGVLVVSPHVSWLDVLVIYAMVSGAFVAKAELISSPALGRLARVMNVIPIDRTQLRRLPDIVGAVAARLRSGQNVVAFPEGTTWCGLAHGPFRPAMFQAAIDAGRPVQPLRLRYHHRDGRLSTVVALVGGDSLARSFLRVVSSPATVAQVHVEALQLPAEHRRDLAMRCEEAVRGTAVARREHALAA